MEDEQIKENKDQTEDPGMNEGENEEAFDKEDLQCRFYRDEWPNSDELVVVSLKLHFLKNTLKCRSKSTWLTRIALMSGYLSTTIERLSFWLRIQPVKE
jgi:hypothetical protein